MKIKNLFENCEETFAENATGTFKKYIRSPLVCPCSFLSTTHLLPPPAPPTHLEGTLVLARTHPLSLNFSTCEILKKEINNEY